MTRGLSREFISDLKNHNGVLSPLLSAVKDDSGLCLQIRDNYINIYYRGGSIAKVAVNQSNSYKPSFNEKYLTIQSRQILNTIPDTIVSEHDSRIWVSALPSLKYAMDLWFRRHPKDEREFQQLIVRENNSGKCARKTDYYICDIEYANANGRFDLIAAYWPSKGPERKKTDNVRLAFIEMKYADGALKGNSGLAGHITGMTNFLSKPERVTSIKNEMKIVFNQMRELGLVDVGNSIASFNNQKPEFIMILANHDPDSSILKGELANIEAKVAGSLPFDLRFAVSSFMGYGLYGQNMYNLNTFQERFKEQL